MTVANIWDGSAWVSPSGFNLPRIWDGSTWTTTKPKVWTNNNWGIYSVPQSRIITVGNAYAASSKYFSGYNLYGYIPAVAGSIDNNELFLWEDTYISEIAYDAGVGVDIIFSVKSPLTSTVTNSNWTTMTIGTTSFTRASASGYLPNYYTDGVFVYTEWYWNTSPSGNPFSAVGTNTTVTWS